MKKAPNPRLVLSFAMAVFGTLGLFTRFIPVSSGELALYRAALASLLQCGYFAVTGRKVDLKAIRKELPLLLFSGALMGINWILLFQTYRYTTVSVATLIYYFAPLIVTVVSTFLFREKLTGKQILCFVMSTVGLVLIVGIGDLGSTNPKGVMFGLSAACFYAAVVLLNKFIKNIDAIQRTLLQFIAAIVVLTPYVALTSGFHLEVLDGIGWTCLLVVGLIHTGIMYCLYFNSVQHLPGQEVSILSYIDPLMAVVVSVVILREPLSLTQAIGGAMILGFTLWNEKNS